MQLVRFKALLRNCPKKLKKGLQWSNHNYVSKVKHMKEDEQILEILGQNQKTTRCHWQFLSLQWKSHLEDKIRKCKLLSGTNTPNMPEMQPFKVESCCLCKESDTKAFWRTSTVSAGDVGRLSIGQLIIALFCLKTVWEISLPIYFMFTEILIALMTMRFLLVSLHTGKFYFHTLCFPITKGKLIQSLCCTVELWDWW